MRNVLWLTGAGGGCLLVASCVSYPYQSGFSSCESEANACYRLCEDIPDEDGYIRCQNHCDRDIDRCFDDAYSPYRSTYGYGGGYGYSSPWYGRYGSWYPDNGYFLSYNYYDRYGYRKRKHRDWDDDDDDHRPPPPPPPTGGGPRGGPRDIDKPRTPNRYYRRSSPPLSGPASPDATRDGAPPTAAPPPRAPRRVSPPSGSPPTYTPPPSPPPATSPPTESSPPPDRPGRAAREERGPGSRRGEGPDPDRD